VGPDQIITVGPDGVVILSQGPPAADAVALRAILDPAAYLDAPTTRRRTENIKIN
jgi:hypothetical protein